MGKGKINNMKKIKSKTGKARKHTKILKHQKIIGLLFSSAVLILPLIVRLKIKSASPEMYPYFPLNNGFIVDLVVYYKNIFFILITSLLVMFFIGERIFPDTPIPTGLMKYSENKKYMALSLTFFIFVLLSYVFSEFKNVSLLGAPNSYEGTLTWICYIVIFLMSINYFHDFFYINYIEQSIPKILIIISTIGIIEYFWESPLETRLIQYLVLPREQWNQLGQLKMISYLGRISTTLANPNYVGQFLVLLLPILFKALYNPGSHKNSYQYFFYIGASFISILTLFLSGAKTAIIAYFIGLAIQFLLHRKHFIYKKVLGIFIFSLTLFAVIFSIQKMGVLNISSKNQPLEDNQIKEGLFINEINLEKTGVVIRSVDKQQLKILYNQDEGIDIYINNQPAALRKEGNQYIIQGEEFPGLVITDYDDYFGVLLKGNSTIFFTNRNGKYYVLGPNGYLMDKINNDPGLGLNKHFLRLATGRGYIWDISLPLLKNTILKGYGADTGVFYIPQNDFAGKINYHSSANMVIDKPHNMFVQVALNFGLVSLVIYLIILLNYYKTCYKIVNNAKVTDDNQKLYFLFIAILSGITNYIICSFFYDSNVSVAPIFWMLLGMGVAVNNRILDLNHLNHP